MLPAEVGRGDGAALWWRRMHGWPVSYASWPVGSARPQAAALVAAMGGWRDDVLAVVPPERHLYGEWRKRQLARLCGSVRRRNVRGRAMSEHRALGCSPLRYDEEGTDSGSGPPAP